MSEDLEPCSHASCAAVANVGNMVSITMWYGELFQDETTSSVRFENAMSRLHSGETIGCSVGCEQPALFFPPWWPISKQFRPFRPSMPCPDSK